MNGNIDCFQKCANPWLHSRTRQPDSILPENIKKSGPSSERKQKKLVGQMKLRWTCNIMMEEKSNVEEYTAKLTAQILTNDAKLIRQCFTVQRGQLPKTYCKSKPRVSWVKEMGYSSLPTSVSWFQLNKAFFFFFNYSRQSCRCCFKWPTNKHQLKVATVKAWQRISKEKTQYWVFDFRQSAKDHHPSMKNNPYLKWCWSEPLKMGEYL